MSTGSLTATYSNIEDGWDGEGNIDTDPMFCNPDSGEYTLAENSPTLNSGADGSNMGALGVGCPIQVDWDFSLSDPVIEVLGSDDEWNPGDTTFSPDDVKLRKTFVHPVHDPVRKMHHITKHERD